MKALKSYLAEPNKYAYGTLDHHPNGRRLIRCIKHTQFIT